MKKWRCKVCGYVHVGDDPPEMCPVCGVGPELFEPQEPEPAAQPTTTVKRVIIIGNGAAGIEAAKTLRELDESVEILVFTDEAHHFYSRIHLSTLIGGDTRREDIYIYPVEWYADQRIRVYLQHPVMQINSRQKTVVDVLGESFSYDRLILATGASPFMPAIKGRDREGIFVLRNLFEADLILAAIKGCSDAVVIGGGILGIEAASSLNKSGLNVTVVESARRIMAAQLDDGGSAVLQSLLEKRGIAFRLGAAAKEFLGEGSVSGVLLSSGEQLPAQMVIVSTGIFPNTGLAAAAGLQVDRGIVVNSKMQTSNPDIYAAGDVAQYANTVYGIWPAAVEQGAVAARNAIGSEMEYRGTTPLHILKVAGVDLTSLGSKMPAASEQEIVHADPAAGQYVKLIHDGEHLLGAMVLGVPGLGFRLEKLFKRGKTIREKLPALQKGDWTALRKK